MVYDFERNRISEREIEVKALVALARFGNKIQKFEALKHLEYVAYPELLAKKINSTNPLEDFDAKSKV